VIGVTYLGARSNDRFGKLAVSRISSFLAMAASAQARRIGDVEADGSVT
jgi:hypothetical protein